MPPLPPVVIIAGPTASGKSALALETAQRFDGEIINADSMQVYRELSVLTARPTARDEAKVPHHLYGTLSAREACSAGKWLDMAVAAINDCHRRGKLAVVQALHIILERVRDKTSPSHDMIYEQRGTMRRRTNAIHLLT